MAIDANERVALGHPVSRVPRNRLTWANIRPLVVPLWLGAENPGAEKGARLLAEELAERWNRPDRQHLADRLQPIDVIDTPVPHDADMRLHRQSLEFLPEVEITSRDVADQVSAAIAAGDLPLTLGGDHAIAIGTIAGAARACTRLGVIWFDTHPDINTPSTSPSGHIHGMPLGVAIGVEPDHARACRILENGGIADDAIVAKLDTLDFGTAAPEELALLQSIAEFPAIVQRAAEEYRPLHITNYVFEVAKRFNDFYHACPVLISEEPVRSARLTLVAATRTTLSNGLALLGIEAPTVM